jgi:hemolysin activation/secretion protein
LNNYRPPSIGEKAYDVAGLVRNLSGWGDVLDAEVSGPIGVSGGVDYSAGWRIPFTRYDTQVSLRAGYSETVVTEEPLEALDIKSRIDRQELRLSQPFWTSLTSQFNLSVSIAREKNSTSLAGMPFAFLPGSNGGVTRAITASLAPDYSYRSERQYFGLRVTMLHAHLLDQTSDPFSYVKPDRDYYVWTAQAHHLIELKRPRLELDSHATLQTTGARISDLHALEIGGVNSVRGYREDEVLVANLVNINVDLRWLAVPARTPHSISLAVGPFFDWGRGYDVGQVATSFSSCGLTVRVKWNRLRGDLAVGARLDHPSFVNQQHGSWQDSNIHAQIAADL